MDQAADLEIGLYRWDAEYYAVDLRYDVPGQPVAIRPRQSNPVKLDLGRLRELVDAERWDVLRGAPWNFKYLVVGHHVGGLKAVVQDGDVRVYELR